MLKDRLDKFFKEKLAVNPEWDKEALWKDIEQAMDESGKHRRVFWFWVFGLFMLAGLSLWWWSNKTVQGVDAPKLHIETKSMVANKQILDKDEPTKQLKNYTNNQNSDGVQLDLQNSKNFVKPEDHSTLNQKGLVPLDGELESQLINGENNFTAELLEKNDGHQLNLDDIEAKELEQSLVDQAEVDFGSQLIDLASIPHIPLKTISSDEKSSQLAFSPVFTVLGASRKVSVLKNEKWQQLGFALGLGLSLRNLETTAQTGEEISNFREMNEQVLENRQLAISYRYGFGKHLHLSSGITYQEQHEKLRLEFTNESIEKRRKPDAYSFTGTNGDVQFIAGEVDVVLKQDVSIQHFNVLRRIDLPVLIGYHTHWKKWGFVLEGGPSISLHQSFTGRVLSNDFEELNSDEIYKDRIGWSVVLQGGVQHAIGESIYASLGVSVNKDMRSAVNKDQSYRMQYTLFNLQAGLAWQF